MADNVILNSGSGGATMRTDDDGTAHWQYIKLAFGADNTQTIVGSLTSNPFPVNIGANAAGIGKAEDTASADLDVGVPAMARRTATPADTSGADLDYEMLQMDNGRLWCNSILGANSGVDIGDVDVTSIIPGTGATNLGKAIGNAVGATDTGVALLGVHDAEASKIAVPEEDYDHLHIGELGGLSVEPEQHNHLDEFDSVTGWDVLGNDADNLLTSTNHLTGSASLIFDKVDGAANTVIAGIDKTITTIDMGELDLHDIVQTACYLSTLAKVDYVFIRIGTSNANYNEWRIADDDLIANEWTVLGVAVGLADFTGNTGTGVDWSAISTIAPIAL